MAGEIFDVVWLPPFVSGKAAPSLPWVVGNSSPWLLLAALTSGLQGEESLPQVMDGEKG